MATIDMAWRETVEALTEGVIFHAAGGEVETCNAAAERILGLTLAQMRGVETLDPDWRAFQEDGSTFAPTSAPAMAALQTGRAQTSLIVGIDKPDGTLDLGVADSRIRSCAMAARPLRSRRSRSVTERRRADRTACARSRSAGSATSPSAQRAEEELRQRNRYIEAILERAPIGFAVHTIDDGVGRFVSARFEEIYGVARGTIDSHFTFFENVWPRDPVLRDEIRRRVVADMSSGDPARMQWENIPVPLAERRDALHQRDEHPAPGPEPDGVDGPGRDGAREG